MWQRCWIWQLSTSGTTVRYARMQQQAQTPSRSPTGTLSYVNIKGTIVCNILSASLCALNFPFNIRCVRQAPPLSLSVILLADCILTPNALSTLLTFMSVTAMFTSTSLVAASSIFALSFAAPTRNNATTHVMVARASYVMYGGDGSMAAGWPSQNSWLSFEDAW